jgi:hypothetical protein
MRIGALAGLEEQPQRPDLTKKFIGPRRAMPTPIPTKFFCRMPIFDEDAEGMFEHGSRQYAIRLPPSLLSRSVELTRRFSAITDDGVLDFQKGAHVTTSSTTAVRLAPYLSGTEGGGGGCVMRPFCPDGYLLAQEAVLNAALCWFPEEISALMTAAEAELAINKKANDDVGVVMPVEELARVLALAPSISDGLRRQFVHLFTQTEHRLRNLLHQGALTAFYFGGLFDQRRHAVEREFWATAEAEGVLISGIYWPFGKPRDSFDQRPSCPLFVLESELAALLSDEPKPPPNPDVTDVLGGGRREAPDESARATSEPQSRRGAKSRGIAEAIDTLWPNDFPNGLSAKERNKAIINWLEQAGYSLPTNPERAIQRVLKARRSR